MTRSHCLLIAFFAASCLPVAASAQKTRSAKDIAGKAQIAKQNIELYERLIGTARQMLRWPSATAATTAVDMVARQRDAVHDAYAEFKLAHMGKEPAANAKKLEALNSQVDDALFQARNADIALLNDIAGVLCQSKRSKKSCESTKSLVEALTRLNDVIAATRKTR